MAPPDPDNGDAQFTRDLLACPPEGVEYTTYTEALGSGELVLGPSLRSRNVVRPRALGAAVGRAALTVLRRAGVLLPDPVRWFTVKGDFDLVHVHCMPVRFLGAAPPIVLSDSAGTFWYWTVGRHMPERKVRRLLRRERHVAGILGYAHPSARLEPAERLLNFVQAGNDQRARVGMRGPSATICPPGVPAPIAPAASDGRTILFVARDFWWKGGDRAVNAFRIIRRRLPDARLLVAGCVPPADSDQDVPGVEWLGPVSRQELYAKVYPRCDLLLYPTRFDIAPLVVMEALAHGLPVVTTAAFALGELVRQGETGILVNAEDVDALATAVSDLLADKDRRSSMSDACRREYVDRFSVERRNQVLSDVYRSVTP